jgi:hypothetical protein
MNNENKGNNPHWNENKKWIQDQNKTITNFASRDNYISFAYSCLITSETDKCGRFAEYNACVSGVFYNVHPKNDSAYKRT